ncbi:glycosyltransferase family 4 protein [Allobaculum sp. JKK-2023]|uniref:glycosyltransferase family 4 protein n=1 Tax=Allobaculum sp. JKK-2023 TaxID=3108943 RepID=UPI002B053394|nr:glycosyltransferase family 4 protein [Allobaculum sp. JKK-2023]
MGKEKDKAVVFVMPRLPFPMVSGRKTSLYHYCRIISEELGYRLVVAAFTENGDNPNEKPEFIDRLVILEKPSKVEKLCNILEKSILSSKFPIQVSLYLSKNAKKQIDLIIQEEHPIAMIADMVRCTEYIRDSEMYKIADLDDRISLRYRRQLEMDEDSINPYGAFLSTLPSFLQKVALFKPLKLAVLKREIKLLTSYELEIGKVCDNTIFVAKNEADAFNYELKEDKAVSIPIGVDIDYFYPQENINKNNIICFLGAMSVAHNESAVRHFITDIFPIITERIPSAIFLVIGGGANGLKSYASENIVFTGKVDDVRKYLKMSKVFVCPMLFGSGIKTKNLEAMAMGLPLVTTSVGSENIDAMNGKEWFIADSDNEFANKVVDILHNHNLERKMSINAREFIVSHFTWDIAKKQFSKLLMKVEEKPI